MATIDPYEAYKQMYQQRTDAIAAQTKQAESDKALREQQAQQTLTNANRGTYTSFMNQINPYGSFASQNNFSSGVNDYFKNASYGTYLTGLGTNQGNYNNEMQNSNSLWQQYLADKAGNEADALTDYNNAVVAQQKYDQQRADEQKAAEQAQANWLAEFQWKQKEAEKDRERQAAQDAEEKRRYDQEWAYQIKQDEAAAAAAARASSSGGSSRGGSSRRSSSKGSDYDDFSDNPGTNPDFTNYLASLYDTAPKRLVQERYTTMGAMDQRHSQQSGKVSNYVVKTTTSPSSIAGKHYETTYTADGRKQTKLVGTKSKVNGKVTLNPGNKIKNYGKRTGGVTFGVNYNKSSSSKKNTTSSKTKTKQTYKKSYNTKTNKGNQVYRNYF